ncbi:MAG: di-trans,poly-cis-decaprenylcistransferase [Alphaproteobacteria bacterium]|nr:MAG: di-trans,poly-cis-decaprenylcistransferase [Alphaproteobacteria bacterium]
MTANPNHIAIIMDGNGRWAKSRLMPRIMGHKRGVETTKSIVRHAGEIGVNYLTLYAFSTENWNRPEDEVNDLMGLLRLYIKSESTNLHENNVRLRIVGFRDRLSDDILKMIEDVEGLTSENTGLNLTVALDYGGRQEILNAVNTVLSKGDGEVDEKTFSSYLFTSDIPDPDLLIRTSGEMRISNFLLWQCAYSEFVFTDVLWPDFTTENFDQCIKEYTARDRRYGGLSNKKASTS